MLPTPSEPASALTRIALGIEYDGRTFCGWQSQAGGGAVQDAVERALAVIADGPVRVHCAGRTDTGVHALEQVVHFDTRVERPLSAWVRGVNANLPHQIAIRWALPVPGDFHARFSARARAYKYLLLNRAQRPGLNNGRVGWYHRPLDADAMGLALTCLTGTHDFSAFRAAECQAKSPVRTVHQANVSRSGDLIVFDFVADGFLHHMIRNIVGAAICVGSGSQAPAWLLDLLQRADRRLAPPTFSPAGLYFAGAQYESHYNLPKVSAGGTAIYA